MKRFLFLMLSTASMVLPCCLANAQQEFPVVTSVETNYVGLGVGMVPDYVGSDDYKFGVMPAFRYEFGDHRSIDLTANYLSANIINADVLRFGPAIRYRFGRDGDVDDAAVKLLPEIDDTTEGGFTLSGNWVLDNNPRKRFVLGTDALWDLEDTHDGMVASVYARYWTPVSEAVDIGLAGNVQYGNDHFNNTYFGVSPTGSAASGLPAFVADGGVNSVSIMPMAVLHLSEAWHIGAGLRYVSVTGDASDSPIVDERGDSSQFIGGLGVIYAWGAHGS